MTRVWLAGLALACALSGAGRAAPTEPAPKDSPPKGPYVVVVGAGAFTDPAIQARPSAEADARDLYDLFADPKYAITTPDRVVLLTATPDDKRKSQKATHDNVVAALKKAVAETGKDDTLVVAMFGRGASAGDKTCLFTANTRFAERAKTGLLGTDIEEALKTAKDRKILMMLDIAFSGFDPGKENIAVPTLRDIVSAVFGGEDAGGDTPPTQNKVLMLSAIPSNTPVVVDGHGLFAKTAVEALKGAADKDGYAPDGLVVVDELVKFLEKSLQEQVRKVGKTVQEKEAIPFIVGEETAHFPVSRNPAVTPKVETRVRALKALAKQNVITDEMRDEGVKLVERMPKLKAMQELRKKYEELVAGVLPTDQFVTARVLIKRSMLLPAEEAERYARTVVKAISVVSTSYVKEITPGEWAAKAVKGLYRRLETPIPADIQTQIADAKSLRPKAISELLADVRTRFGKREDLDDGKDVDTTILMMLAELRDPYTTYFDAATLKKMDAPLKGELTGVGIQIRRDLVRDGLLVVSPIRGGPAYKAGIQAGDLITGIKRTSDPRGKPLASDAPRELSTAGMKTESAIDIILGKEGVPVTLVVDRDGKSIEFPMTRAKVSVESVLGVKRDANDEWEFMIDAENKIGYINLTQFVLTSTRDLQAAVEQLKEQGVRGLVLDLRFNPGGYLTAACDVCDLFLKSGDIVTIRSRTRPPYTYKDRGLGSNTEFPIAVLINGQSASASEIVSACLQDQGRAIVVGERSYGKGSVQVIKGFGPTGGEIKMTEARYFPPSGRNIDKPSTDGKPEDEWGVKPDKGYEVKLTRDEVQDLAEHHREHEIIRPAGYKPKKPEKPFTDKQLNKALEYLRGQVKAADAGKPAKGNG